MKNTTKILNYRDKVYLYYSQNGIPLRIATGIEWNDLKENQNHIDKLFNNLNKIVIDYFYKENVYPETSFIKSKLNIIYNKIDTIESLYKLYLEYKLNEVKDGTYKTLKKQGLYFNEYNDNVEKININKIDDTFIKKFQQYLFDKNISDNTSRIILANTKAFIKYCEENQYIKTTNINWKPILKNIKKYKDTEETLNQMEIEFLISKRETEENVNTKRILNLFIFQIFSGVRHSDLVRIDKKYLVSDNKMKMYSQKTGTEFQIDLNDITKDILNEYNGHFNIILSYYNTNIKSMLKEYSDEMPSFKKKIKTTKIVNLKEQFEYIYRYNHISSHTARRTFITNCIELGIPWNTIMLHSGHINIQTLNKYINRKSDEETNLSELLVSGKNWENRLSKVNKVVEQNRGNQYTKEAGDKMSLGKNQQT